ncbi:hypothetical protein, partial [Mesorhizobium sp. M0701]|uniref:hypothetical protein n=1 Tax=Mesorhizobium sp. M0701 TaxID=2956989 RepID=UPI003339BAC4
MLILNETVAAGDDIAGRIDRLRHALSLWSRIMVVNKGPAAGAFFCASGSSNMKWTKQPCDEVERRPPGGGGAAAGGPRFFRAVLAGSREGTDKTKARPPRG